VRKKLSLLILLLAVLTAGCVQADLKLDVKDDGSGTYSAVIAVNADLFKSLGGLSALDPDAAGSSKSTDVCQQMIDGAKEDNPSGTKVEPYKNGDFCGVKISAPFDNIEDGVTLLNSGSSSGGTSLEDVTLEKQGNGWVFDAEWNPDDASGSTGGLDSATTKQFLQGFSFVIRIKLPGGQVEQNADLIEGDGTMVWNLEPTADRTLNARTDANAPVIKSKVQTDAGKALNSGSGSGSGASSGDDGGGSKTWIFVVIGLVVIAAIAAFVLMKRNKTKAVPPAAVPGSPLASDPVTGSPPMEAFPASATSSDPFTSSTATAPVAAAPVATAAQAAATEPQWDAARNAYIQWDGVGGRWMQYDQTAGAWKPIE
jgi:LPXTG-motif cell wall-anchored protein